MNSPLFSFVLPAYKARFLHEAIESILSQTFSNFELIIVNDASPEDLKSIVGSFDDPRIQYHENKQNIGGKDLVAQWNHCIEFARGEFLIIASDDDTYHRLYLAEMNELIKQYPACNIYRCRRRVIYTESANIEEEPQTDSFISKNDFLCQIIKRQIATGLQQHIFRKSRLVAIGGFKNFPCAWFADDAIAILMSDNGIAIHQDILFNFKIFEESITGKKNNSFTLQKKLQALSLYDEFAKKQIKENLPSKSQKDVMEAHTQFINLHYYNLLLNSSFTSIISTIPFILNQFDISSKIRLFYLSKSLVKHMTFN